MLFDRMTEWLDDAITTVGKNYDLQINTSTGNTKQARVNAKAITYLKQYHHPDSSIQFEAFALPSMFIKFLDDLYISEKDRQDLAEGTGNFAHFMLGHGEYKNALFVLPKFAKKEEANTYKKSVISVVKAYMVLNGYAMWDEDLKRVRNTHRIKTFKPKDIPRPEDDKTGTWVAIAKNKYIDIDGTTPASMSYRTTYTWTPTPKAYLDEGILLLAKDGTRLYSKDLIGEAIKTFRELPFSDWKEWNKNSTKDKFSPVMNSKSFNDDFLD